ncbi:unnamed protein product [Prunus brigantina]
MRSVNTPATPTTRATSTLGLATFSPAHTQSYLPSYDGTYPASYGVYPRSTKGQTTQAWSNGAAGPTTSKFRSEISGTPTIQRSKPSEPGKYAICDIRSGP